ncbi:hypothetical protein PS2_001450 [Malus domestica]
MILSFYPNSRQLTLNPYPNIHLLPSIAFAVRKSHPRHLPVRRTHETRSGKLRGREQSQISGDDYVGLTMVRSAVNGDGCGVDGESDGGGRSEEGLDWIQRRRDWGWVRRTRGEGRGANGGGRGWFLVMVGEDVCLCLSRGRRSSMFG